MICDEQSLNPPFSHNPRRTIHSVDKDLWPGVFGKLHEDYLAGKDLSNWSKYLPPNTASSSHHPKTEASPPPLSSSSAPSPSHRSPGIGSEMTGGELEVQMHELQTHVAHLEKTLTTVKDGRERAEASQKMVIQRLVAENMSVIEEVREMVLKEGI